MALPLMAIAAGAGILGKLFGGAAKGQTQERAAQNDAAQASANRATSQYGIQQGAMNNLLGQQEQSTLNRAQMGISAPSARMKQAILGSLLQNVQDAKVTPPAGVNMAQLSGGLKPSTLSAATRAGGGELEKQALMALMSKSDVPAATDFVGKGLLTPPASPDYKSAGTGESLLSLLGLLGGVGGAISEIGNINRKPAGPDYGGMNGY